MSENMTSNVQRTATNQTTPWFASSEARTAHELIKLYQQEFGGDWKQFYAATVRIETQCG